LKQVAKWPNSTPAVEIKGGIYILQAFPIILAVDSQAPNNNGTSWPRTIDEAINPFKTIEPDV